MTGWRLLKKSHIYVYILAAMVALCWPRISLAQYIAWDQTDWPQRNPVSFIGQGEGLAPPASGAGQGDGPVVAGATAVAELAGGERTASLRASIQTALADLNGQWGIGIEDLVTGETILLNADRSYPAASQYKLFEFYAITREIAAGNLSLDRMTRMVDSDYSDSLLWDEELQPGDRVSVKGLIRVLVIQSSNAASHALSRLAGLTSIPATVNAAAQELGLPDTRMAAGGGAVTSVRDLIRYYEQLYRGQVISTDTSQSMLALLKEQQINDRIPALLPASVKVAHKTGNLPGVVNDGGIMFGPRRDVILVVLSEGADHDEGTAAIGKIGQLVYRWANG